MADINSNEVQQNIEKLQQKVYSMTKDINLVTQNIAEYLTNSVNMTSKFYDIFLNPTAMYVDLEMYNEDNELVTVTIPNRAMEKVEAGSSIVLSVNSQTGIVELTAEDVGAQPTLVSGTNIKTVNNTSLLDSGNIDVQAPLVSGSNIKTINSTSLLGSGNISVQPTLVSGTSIKTVNSTSLLGSGDVSVQPTLVSGSNIKTINNESILGSGNIDVAASGVDEDRLHALKGYEDAGELLVDKEGLADVTSYAHSTFDVNKFTVVGSPTITSEGIASGFSTANYLTTSMQLSALAGKSWRIEDTFTVAGNLIDYTLNLSEDLQEFGNITVSNNGLYFSYYIGDLTDYNFGVINLTQIPNGIYKYFLEFDKTTSLYTLGYSNLDGSNIHTTYFLPGAANKELFTINTRPNQHIMIGNRLDYVAALPTDLKQLVIKADGALIFSGNKTGIDTIKPDDYTVVGSPTISDDGVLTGTDSSNYVVLPSIPFGTANSWEIEGEYTPQTSSSSFTETIIGRGTGTTAGINLMNRQGYWAAYIGNSASDGWITWNATITAITAGQKYKFKFQFTGSAYKLLLSTNNGESYTTVWNAAPATAKTATITQYVGYINGATTGFSGILDLNELKIYINNDLYCQPCLKIPYTFSKTGSKIVDSVYRPRVNDMYSQFGYAPFYTLQEEDKGNYGIIGSPTITGDFIASNFASTNYLTKNLALDCSKDFEISCNYTCIGEVTGRYQCFWSIWNDNDNWTDDRFFIGVNYNDSTTFLVAYPSGSNVSTTNFYPNKFSTGNSYLVKLVKTSGSLKVYIDDVLIDTISIDETYYNFTSSKILIGSCEKDGHAKYLANKTDLKAFKVYSENKLIYQAVQPPCFTLPQGEIYGIIDKLMPQNTSRNVGEVIASAIPLVDAGLHLMDGALIQGGGIYSDFVDYMDDLYNSMPKTYKSDAFTVVGSPTISADGIASGFSNSNYLTKSLSIPANNNYTIKGSFTTGVVTNYSYIFSLAYGTANQLSLMKDTDSGCLSLVYPQGAWVHDSSLILNDNTTYNFEIVVKGAIIELYVDDVRVLYNDTFTNGTINTLRIGVSSSSNDSFVGSIDLKQLLIIVDGETVLNGSNVAGFCTEPEWQNSVQTYGVCGKFVYDNVNNTVRLPKITGFIEGTATVTDLGNLIEAGLPDHTHTYNGNTYGWEPIVHGDDQYRNYDYTNAVLDSGLASASNSIYGNSTTVQPQATKVLYYIVIATSVKSDVLVNMDKVATDLNGKMNKDGSNATCSVCVESYTNGASWYRVYSNGWCEQGSHTGNLTANQTVALLKSYSSANYTLVITEYNNGIGTNGQNYDRYITSQSTSNFTTNRFSDQTGAINWYACGYIN